MKQSILRNFLRVIPILFLLVLAACGQRTPAFTSIPTPAETAAPQLTPDPTEPPTPTTPPPLILLLASPDTDPSIAGDLQTLLAATAEQKGYRFETRPSLSQTEISPEVKLVVAVSPVPISDLVSTSPQVDFIAIGYPGFQPAENLSVVSFDAVSAAYQGFLAGFTSAVVSEDWRTGIVTVSDTPEGMAARQGFILGAEYFCGLCRNVYPPYYDPQGSLIAYPTYVELPAASGSQEWLAAAQTLIEREVEVVYIFPGVTDTALFESLASAGMKLIAGSQFAEDLGIETAVIETDAVSAVERVLEGWQNEQSGMSETATLKLVGGDAAILTEGKLRLIEKMLSDLEAGYINPGVSE